MIRRQQRKFCQHRLKQRGLKANKPELTRLPGLLQDKSKMNRLLLLIRHLMLQCQNPHQL